MFEIFIMLFLWTLLGVVYMFTADIKKEEYFENPFDIVRDVWNHSFIGFLICLPVLVVISVLTATLQITFIILTSLF